tara:strand:- start:296 stop:1177 length:882 start_codon:yes stop_codon:yes gene_type:complete
MATLNLGRLKPVFIGAWNSSTAYNIDDIVVRSDESYISIQAGSNQDPASASAYWTKMAAKGTDGTDVSTTLTTQGDVLYRDGSGLQRLAAGTSGQVLQTGGSGANPSWGDVSGGVIQTKMAMDGSTYSVSTQVVPGGTVTSCYEITPLTLTLTPSSTSSKFLIDLNLMAAHEGSYMAGGYLTYQVSGGTEYAIASSGTRGITFRVDADLSNSDMGQGTTNPMAMIAPNTTSAITFRCRVFKADVNTPNIFINRPVNNASDEDDGGFTISSMMVTELDGGVSTVSSTNMDIQNT